MNRVLSSAFLLLFVLCVPGCGTIREEGDAISYGRGHFETRKLPRFPIGEKGVHQFKVSGLSSRSFPFQMRVYTQRSLGGSIRKVPFDDARFRVEILSDQGGRALAATSFRMNRWRFSGREGEYEQTFWSPGQPAIPFQKSYRVRVTVLEPSDRRWDEGQIYLR